MRFLAGLGALIWSIGLLTLVLNAFGNPEPGISHIDTLGLGMVISGAIFAVGAREE